MTWQQIYDPFGSMFISTALAAVPVVVMLVGLGFLHLKAHVAAGLGLLAVLVIAVVAYGMPIETPLTFLGGSFSLGESLGMTLGFLAASLAVVAWIFKTGYRLKA